MNERQRFLASARFDTVDRAFLLPPWMWGSTRERWHNEGLPHDVVLTEYFETDRERGVPLSMQGPYGPHLHPPLERKVLEETESYLIIRDEEGNTLKVLRSDPSQSMPEWVAYPMQSRRDWEEIIKPRLDPSIPGRSPGGERWEHFLQEARQRDYPLGVWCGSFYGWPRSFLGVENLSLLFTDDPILVHEMCEHIADFVIAITEPILKQVQVDYAFIWEDMAGKAGPLCSPRTYRELMLSPLKRVTEHLRRHGVDIILVDSDGNNDPLIPLWLEAGVTGLRPFERAADCDPVATRRQYGKNLVLQGGIDKRALAAGLAAIDKEVLSQVPWLCLQGGYFPQVDHLVPPDVSLENYRYYSRLLRQVVEDPERYLQEARRRGFWEG